MSVIWGIPYLLIKIALEGLSVPVLVFARTLIGAAVLLPLAMSRSNARIIVQHWKPLVAFAFFEIIAAWLLLSDAEHHLSSSTTGLLIAAAPIIAARYLTDVPALPMTAACLGLAALVYAAPAALHWPQEMPSTRVLIATGVLAVVCTALAFLVFFALIREVGAARALVFTYVNPAVALAAGVIVLSEPLTPWNIGGLALILVGSALATRHAPELAEAAVGSDLCGESRDRGRPEAPS